MGCFSLWRFSTAETHTHAEWEARWRLSVGCWPFTLSVSSPSPTLFPLSLSLSLSPRPTYLFPPLPFFFVSASSSPPFVSDLCICSLCDCGPFHCANDMGQWSIVLRRMFAAQWGEISVKTVWLVQWKVRMGGRGGSHIDRGTTKCILLLNILMITIVNGKEVLGSVPSTVVINHFCFLLFSRRFKHFPNNFFQHFDRYKVWVVTGTSSLTLALVFLNQIRGKEKKEKCLVLHLRIACAVNIDPRLKPIRIMEQKTCRLGHNVLGLGIGLIE